MSWRFWLSDKTVRKFEELPIYRQRQNCSPEILVSSKVRLMWIFVWVCWREGVKWEWGGRKWRFSLLYNLHIQGHNNYYIVLCSPLVALHWHQNRWPWMTLNGHFALKSGSSSASNGLALRLSEKTVPKFAALRIYCQRQQKCII